MIFHSQDKPTKKAGAKPHRPSSSSLVYQCQYIRGQKHEAMAAIASGRDFPALISNANNNIDFHCVENKCNQHVLLNITKLAVNCIFKLQKPVVAKGGELVHCNYSSSHFTGAAV